MIVPENTISTEHIYLAAFESFRDEAAIFVAVLTENQDPLDPKRFHEFKIRSALPSGAARDAGSTKAILYAKNYVSPSVKTIICYTTPFEPAEIDLSFYPRLEIERIPKEQNPAWDYLIKATAAFRQ